MTKHIWRKGLKRLKSLQNKIARKEQPSNKGGKIRKDKDRKKDL